MSDTSGTTQGGGERPIDSYAATGAIGAANNPSTERAATARVAKTIEALGGLIGAAQKLQRSLGGTASTGAGNYANAISTLPIEMSGGNTGSRPSSYTKLMSMFSGRGPSGGGGGGGGGGGTAGLNAAMIASQIGSALGQALSARVERGYQYSLSADRMNVLYQQMTGMSQQQVQATYRQPLTNYRLGGGESINALLGMQARTGISAAGQARSVEAIRTMSGYSYSAEDATRMISTLGSAQVANRMFMTMGTSLYGIGGKQNDTMSVIQAAVRGAGLMDPRMAATAMQQGSATRQRLSFMGVPEDMQDMIIQYAQENVAFNKKGGRGMYDPSKKADRRLMGIEENFATQKEETERLKTRREEKFYDRQADNFADLERATQTLTKAFEGLEDRLSGIVGGKISAGGFGKVAGGVMSGLGLAAILAAPFTGGTSLAVAGAAMAGAGAFMTGDPVGGGQNSGTTYSNPGNEVLQKARQNNSFSKLHPTMKERVSKIILASGGRVGFTEGWRSMETQRRGFLDRHEVVGSQEEAGKNGHYFEGKWWKLKDGQAPMAPPGRSMHELGLAADLNGDMNWLMKNADKFGLKHFNAVNNEPWHVQPKELPNSRAAYEKSGSTFGGGSPSAALGGGQTGMAEGATSGAGLSTYSGMSISEIIDAHKQQNAATLGNVSGAGGLSYGVGSSTPTKSLNGGAGALSGDQIVRLLKSVGFAGEDLVKAVGISYRESRWDPDQRNPVPPDNSYGLFQINMLDRPGYMLGASRRKRFNLTSNEQLYDPLINARAAKNLHGTDKWTPWKLKGSETTNVDMQAAAATVRAAERTGDPVFPTKSSGSSGGTAIVNGGHNITIAPEIHLHGADLGVDLKRIAKEVGRLIKQEVDLTMLRSS